MGTINDKAETILLADDEPQVQKVVQRFLYKCGYELIEASNGREALSKTRSQHPNIVLLDINMPEMDGLTVCQKLREDALTRMTPILMLTARANLEDKVLGLRLGADDYLTKPFELDELKARIDTLLRRTKNMIFANPLTQLPGSPAIQEEIDKRIQSGLKFGVAYVDIDNFKAYNDVYGYQKGDEVIKWTSETLQSAINIFRTNVRESSWPFLGHIGGDDFILIDNSNAIEGLCQEVISAFDKNRGRWYSGSHVVQGYIQSKDRQGNINKFPLMTLSIGISTNDRRSITHYAQIAQITSELKKFIKGREQKEKSAIVTDRRTW